MSGAMRRWAARRRSAQNDKNWTTAALYHNGQKIGSVINITI